jgi:hypothetical protein
MNILLIFLVILLLLIFLAIAIDKSNIFKKPEKLTNKGISQEKQQGNLPSNVNLPYPTWSQPVPYPNANSGSGLCSAYTFIAGQYTPGIPSYSYLNSNDTRGYIIQPTDPNFVCIDNDQIFAYTISHKCINSKGTSAGAGCFVTVDSSGYKAGDSVPEGTVEGDDTIPNSSLLYAPCTPSNLNNNKTNSNYCLGNIGLIIPQFTPETNYEAGNNQCLASITQGNTGIYDVDLGYNFFNTLLQECDLSESSQIFRFVRYAYDTTNGLVQNDNGPLAAIIHRYSGFYLAPKLNTVKTFNSNNKIQYQYIYDNPVINYEYILDNTNNGYNTSISLILLNPIYDNRQGVYWLLQNQTYNPKLDPQTMNFNSYEGIGVYPNQENYATQFRKKITTNNNETPTVQSYYFQQTVKYCNENNGSPAGCGGSIISPTISNNSTASCLFGTFVLTQTPSTVTNVPLDISPQQIVYIPDLNLLPNSDASAIWTYLINSYSINIDINNNPILTPYRTNMKANIQYNCSVDDNDSNNFFTYLQPVNKQAGIQFLFVSPYNDSQFINYSSYSQQIQTGVSGNNPSGNANFNQYSNPFN